jgi:two-component SAPR family response regulator
MPGLCGIDLAKNKRQINNKVKIFLMTAFDTADLKITRIFKRQNLID